MSHLFIRMAKSFAFGFTLPFTALKLVLRHPFLLALSILPATVTFFAYTWILTRLQGSAEATLLSFLQGHGLSIGGSWEWLVRTITWILLVMMSVMTFSFIAGTLAVPLNDLLAERAERYASVPLTPVSSFGFFWRLRLMRIDLMKSLFSCVVGVLALFVSWIPIVNLIAGGLAVLLLAFQFISYPQTRRGQGLVSGLGFLVRYPFSSFGLGLVCSILFAIPLLSIGMVPLAVISGTLLYAQTRHDPELN